MKIYIAGKISGLKDGEAYGEAYRYFRIAEQRIREAGHHPINPMKLGWMYPGLEYREYIRIDRALIDICDGVLFLDNWKDSRGAQLEYEYAKIMGKDIFTEDEITSVNGILHRRVEIKPVAETGGDQFSHEERNNI